MSFLEPDKEPCEICGELETVKSRRFVCRRCEKKICGWCAIEDKKKSKGSKFRTYLCSACHKIEEEGAIASCSVKPNDVLPGKTFRGKRFLENPFIGNNDRHVLWVSGDKKKVQYNSDTVTNGRHYPTVSMLQFCKWAKEEVFRRPENNEYKAQLP